MKIYKELFVIENLIENIEQIWLWHGNKTLLIDLIDWVVVTTRKNIIPRYDWKLLFLGLVTHQLSVIFG